MTPMRGFLLLVALGILGPTLAARFRITGSPPPGCRKPIQGRKADVIFIDDPIRLTDEQIERRDRSMWRHPSTVDADATVLDFREQIEAFMLDVGQTRAETIEAACVIAREAGVGVKVTHQFSPNGYSITALPTVWVEPGRIVEEWV